MIPLARRNLLAEKAKFLTTAFGTGVSILMMLAILGIYFGAINAAKAIPQNSGAKYWVVQTGSADMYHTFSILPAGMQEKLEQIDGVEKAAPLINHATRIKVGDDLITSAVIGYEINSGLGAPWDIVSGQNIKNYGEIVVDRSMAIKNNIEINDIVEVGNKTFKVVGFSGDTNTFVFQYVFIPLKDALEAFETSHTVNYYLLKTSGNVDKDTLDKKVASLVKNAMVKESAEISDANVAVIKTSFLPIIAFLIIIGLFAGMTVIGVTVYTTTSERAREFGVLKAIGIKNTRLFRIVLQQAFVISIVGFFAGVLLYFLVQFLAYKWMPELTFALDIKYYVYILLLTLLMSVLASIVSIRKVLSIDPALVFKA